MGTDPITTIPNGSVDISNQLPDINSLMSNILGPLFWASLVLTVLMMVLYIYSMQRRRKVEKAILDMQKILNEMNEREKTRSAPQATPVRPESRTEIIAAYDPPVNSTDNSVHG